MINKIATKFLAAVGLTIAMVGCVKKDDFFNTSSSGENTKSLIKITDGGEAINQRARNVSPTIDTFLLLEVRRDPKTSAELNQALTVKVANDTGVIGRYNRANGTAYEQLPSSLYTLLTDVNTLTFQPGEISKEIKIRLNKTNLDLSKSYALGFKITDASGAQVSTEMSEAIYAIGVKNKYDGLYEANGTMVDLANSALTGNYPWSVEFRTSGPNSVILWDHEEDYILHPILSAGAWSYYGSFGVEITFDPVTNKVVSVTNPYGQPAGNTRSAQLDPSGVNQWDPATKQLKIKYFMLQPSVMTTAPYIRTTFDETFTYKGGR